MKPLNDLAKIQLDKDEYGLGGDTDTAESGILVEVPEKLYYFGMWSFAFEESFMARKELDELLEYWKSKVGKRVYWTALSEKGNVIKNKKSGERFAFVKFTSLICEDESDGDGENIHGNGNGSFKA